jgi:pyruvate/2-oxoglutarate dehydrogenase complex dihydrolipoamide dehydrogenase (E3) component
VGGTCIFTGCTPTKIMVASARVAYLARRASEYGVEVGPVSVDLAAVRKRKRNIVDSWSESNRRALTDREDLELVFGEASFQGPHRVAVRLLAGGTRILEAKSIFINAGARPRIPALPGLESVPYLDSTSIMELARVPEHLLILGGGFIGLEFGQMYRRFGSAVTILETRQRLASQEDEDVSEAIQEILEEDGIRFRLDTEALSVAPTRGSGVSVRLRTGGGAEEEATGSHLLLAVGRVPNTDALDAETAGLELDERGYIRTNDRLETSVPGIYALGDVNGGPPFTHVSYDDFRIVRDRVLEGKDASRAGRILAYTVFIDPELGRVGMSERQARARGLEVRVARLPMSGVARALEREETRGFMKAVVEAGTGRLLGAAVLGIQGGELAAMIQLAMMGDLPYGRLRDAVFTHPTLSESLNTLFAGLAE